jgi:hypothetical protein
MTPQVWIIEVSKDGGAWEPLQSVGFKVRRESAERLVNKENISHAALPPYNIFQTFKFRAVRYVPVEGVDG